MTAVFDPAAVRRLELDTQSPAFVRSLVETYQRMLGARVDRLVRALVASDGDAALDAALSLRVSSVMTGASEMAEIAGFVVDDLRNDDLPAGRAQALLLAPATIRVRAALDDHLGAATSAQGSTDSIR